MNARSLSRITVLLALALLAGCGLEPTRPPLDATWGMSVRMAVENQKLNPTLGGDRPVVGLDGVYAKNALEAYRKSSEADPRNRQGQEPKQESILTVKEAK